MIFCFTGLELSQMQGIIPARSRQIISAMVKPIRRVTYQFAISYQLVTPEGMLFFTCFNHLQTNRIIHIIKSEWSIVYIEVKVSGKKIVIVSLKIHCVLANSADPDEISKQCIP